MAEPIDVLEALLFASDIPVEAVTVQDVLGLASPAEAAARRGPRGPPPRREGAGPPGGGARRGSGVRSGRPGRHGAWKPRVRRERAGRRRAPRREPGGDGRWGRFASARSWGKRGRPPAAGGE